MLEGRETISVCVCVWMWEERTYEGQKRELTLHLGPPPNNHCHIPLIIFPILCPVEEYVSHVEEK